MANIRQRAETVERLLLETLRGKIPEEQIPGVLDYFRGELDLVQRLLEKAKDAFGPVCCFSTEDGKIGCGRYTDPAHEVYELDILAPLDEFDRYCQRCRVDVRDSLPRLRGDVARLAAIHNLALEEILADLEKLHLAQKAIEHLHIPVTDNEQLNAATRKIIPYAQALTYHRGRFANSFKEAYFGLGTDSASTHVGFGNIRIDQGSRGQPWAYSALAHEINHMLLGVGFNEALVTLLGLETDAALALAGDRNHEVSLYRILKNTCAHTAYVKARTIHQMERWRKTLERLWPIETVTKLEADYRKEDSNLLGFSSPLSHYTVAPYLALKEALRSERSAIPPDDLIEFNLEVPRLLELSKRCL